MFKRETNNQKQLTVLGFQIHELYQNLLNQIKDNIFHQITKLKPVQQLMIMKLSLNRKFCIVLNQINNLIKFRMKKVLVNLT